MTALDLLEENATMKAQLDQAKKDVAELNERLDIRTKGFLRNIERERLRHP